MTDDEWKEYYRRLIIREKRRLYVRSEGNGNVTSAILWVRTARRLELGIHNRVTAKVDTPEQIKKTRKVHRNVQYNALSF